MKQGVILYVTEGKDEVPAQGRAELTAMARSLGVAHVCVAVTEPDIDYAQWLLIAKGVDRIVVMKVAYNNALQSFESRRAPVCAWG
jgi:hypothetical protein